MVTTVSDFIRIGYIMLGKLVSLFNFYDAVQQCFTDKSKTLFKREHYEKSN